MSGVHFAHYRSSLQWSSGNTRHRSKMRRLRLIGDNFGMSLERESASPEILECPWTSQFFFVALPALHKGIAKGGVKNRNKGGCKRLFAFVHVCSHLLAFACVCAPAFACVCLRLSAFVCVCLRLLAFAYAPLCCAPLCVTLTPETFCEYFLRVCLGILH